MISIGIIGGTGYTGKELVKIFAGHPLIKEYIIYANNSSGKDLFSVFPDLEKLVDNQNIFSINEVSDKHDLYFTALPHGESLKYIPQLIAKGKHVIDLGGDYRLDSEELYFQWYNFTHTSPYLLKSKFYGLADFYNDENQYKNAKLISNPGCYPTAVLLSILPLLPNYAENILSVSCNAYSGTSGAGKSAKTELLLSEMDGNVKAYNVNKHRHEPEILQELHKNGFHSPFSFTTHLLPVSNGIYSTTAIHLKEKIFEEEIINIYKKTFQNSPFVRIRNFPPELKWVVNSNFCDINISVKDKVIIVTSAIDNLIKGASGQAVQNMNKLFGWDENIGLLKKEFKNVSVY